VVRALSDEIMVMRNGQVVERGTVEAIFDKPKEQYTRELITAAFLRNLDSGDAGAPRPAPNVPA
jgi:ABC-type microcin C transport system duplicated ATPase subunit YejF